MKETSGSRISGPVSHHGLDCYLSKNKVPPVLQPSGWFASNPQCTARSIEKVTTVNPSLLSSNQARGLTLP